jgi:hypothetical protein
MHQVYRTQIRVDQEARELFGHSQVQLYFMQGEVEVLVQDRVVPGVEPEEQAAAVMVAVGQETLQLLPVTEKMDGQIMAEEEALV